MDSLLQVSIDFEHSHLVFPTIIACILGVLSVAILLTRYKQSRQSVTQAPELPATDGTIEGAGEGMDKPRFFGTLLLTLLYFSAMVPVGDYWPNTGLGFLLCSIPYILATGLLFMHERTLRNARALIAVALIAPTVIWYLFTELFFLTLP